MYALSSRLSILSDNNNRKTAPYMENLREQIFQATDNFLTAIQHLTKQHTALVLQGDNKQRVTPAVTSTAPRPRGLKRGADELEQLSKRFVQFVQDNPGLRIEQINAQLGTTTPELALPIRKLVSNGTVKVKGQKRATTYFAGKPAAAKTGESLTTGKSSKGRARPKKSRTGRAKSKKK